MNSLIKHMYMTIVGYYQNTPRKKRTWRPKHLQDTIDDMEKDRIRHHQASENARKKLEQPRPYGFRRVT